MLDCLQRVDLPCTRDAVGNCEVCRKPICAEHGEASELAAHPFIHCTTCVMLARHFAKPLERISRWEREEFNSGAGRSLVGIWER